MSDADAELLLALRALQGRFLDAVRDGRWDEAGTLQGERFALIEHLLGEPPLSAAAAAQLTELAAADRALLPQVERARAQAGADLQALTRARKALAAYGAP